MPRSASAVPVGGPHSGRWIALTAATTLLVVAAASATLAVMLNGSGRGGPASGRATSPAQVTRQPSSAPPSVIPAAALAGGNRVAVAASAAHAPDARAVVSFLNRYFAAIDSRDYQAYRRMFSPAVRSALSRAAFTAGYGSTKDSLATLRSIGVVGPGQLNAVVTFTSHQQPGESPSQSSCTRWRVSLYLVRNGYGYLLQTPPAGYAASFRACP